MRCSTKADAKAKAKAATATTTAVIETTTTTDNIMAEKRHRSRELLRRRKMGRWVTKCVQRAK